MFYPGRHEAKTATSVCSLDVENIHELAEMVSNLLVGLLQGETICISHEQYTISITPRLEHIQQIELNPAIYQILVSEYESWEFARDMTLGDVADIIEQMPQDVWEEYYGHHGISYQECKEQIKKLSEKYFPNTLVQVVLDAADRD